MPHDRLVNPVTLLQGESLPVIEPSSASPTTVRKHNVLAWGLVALLLLVQFLAFRQYALREVVWSYPPYHDQLQYLGRAYDGYERILSRGIFAGLSEMAGFRHLEPEPPAADLIVFPPRPPADPNQPLSPNGTFLHIQAALLFLLLGPGRLSALSLCFMYLALFQCVVVATVRWLTGRWSLAFIALGWLLSSPSQFDGTGGIIDFRIDLTAMCLYGVFICIVIRSSIFSEWRWSALAGFCGAMLIGFRFIAAVYLAMVMALLMFFLLARLAWLWRRSAARSPVIRQLIGALIACAIILLLAGPLIIHHYPAIHDYYIANHMAGQDRHIRALGQGIRDLWTSLSYYPTSLYEFHAGPFFCKSAALLVLFAVGAWLTTRRMNTRRTDAPIDFVSAAFFVGCCMMVPFVLLSSDQDKTPVVADIMVGPLLWLIMLGVSRLIRAYGRDPLPQGVRWGLIAFAVVVLSVGMQTQLTAYSQRLDMSKNREQIESLEKLYDRIDVECHDAAVTNPLVASDTLEDYIGSGALQILTYERHGRLLAPVECMANTIDALTPDELLGQIKIADFVLLTDFHAPYPGDFEYPFETSIRAAKPQLVAYCRENLIEEGHARLKGREVTLYSRPLLTMKGITEDGWVIRSGITLNTLAEYLRKRPVLQLNGSVESGIPDRPVKILATLQIDDQPDVSVPGTFEVSPSGYKVTLTFNPATLPPGGMVHIHVAFSGVAMDPAIEARDIRGLIMRTPTSVTWAKLKGS